jgi:hypothetical protein
MTFPAETISRKAFRGVSFRSLVLIRTFQNLDGIIQKANKGLTEKNAFLEIEFCF